MHSHLEAAELYVVTLSKACLLKLENRRKHLLNPPIQTARSRRTEFENNRALVKADVRDRKTFISVTGPAAGRRRLLAVIRSDLERIHADIKKLQVTEMVPVLGRKDAVVPYGELMVFEKSGIWKIPRVFGGEVVQLDVRKLLDGRGHRRLAPP